MTEYPDPGQGCGLKNKAWTEDSTLKQGLDRGLYLANR